MQYKRDIDTYITNRSLELIAAGGYSESQIASMVSEELGIEVTRNTVHGRVYRIKVSSGLEDRPVNYMPYFSKYEPFYRKEIPPVAKVSYDLSKGNLKILVLNDMHIPFQYTPALETALVQNMSADVVVTSELMDLYSLSPFSKDKHVSFELEVEETIRILEFLNDRFPLTYIVGAGHEKRLPRYILSNIRSDLLFLIETNLIELLARPFNRIIPISRQWMNINDAMFSHLNKYSSAIPVKAVSLSHDWFTNWKDSLDIPSYRLLVQAHSHHSGILNTPSVQLIESGCLQSVPEWLIQKSSMRPWVHGWVVINQKDGVTDLNATKLFVYRK